VGVNLPITLMEDEFAVEKTALNVMTGLNHILVIAVKL